MKRLITFLIFFVALSGKISAQIALEGFNYQTIVRDNAGVPIANKAINFRFSLLDGSANGNAQYVETKLITTNATGLVNHIVGKGSPVQGTFTAVPFQNANQFLKVEADINGGANFQTIGTTQLVSVPYAQYAAKASKEIKEILTINGYAPDFPLEIVNYAFPAELHSVSYTAGEGEVALINMDVSGFPLQVTSTQVLLNVGYSKNGSAFTTIANLKDSRFQILNASLFSESITAKLPLEANASYIFSPALILTGDPRNYYLTGHGTIMIIKQQ